MQRAFPIIHSTRNVALFGPVRPCLRQRHHPTIICGAADQAHLTAHPDLTVPPEWQKMLVSDATVLPLPRQTCAALNSCMHLGDTLEYEHLRSTCPTKVGQQSQGQLHALEILPSADVHSCGLLSGTVQEKPDYRRFAVVLLRRIEQSVETVSARQTTISHGSRDVLPSDALATRWQVSRVRVQTFHDYLHRSSDLGRRNKGVGIDCMNACHPVNEPEASLRSTWHVGQLRTFCSRSDL